MLQLSLDHENPENPENAEEVEEGWFLARSLLDSYLSDWPSRPSRTTIKALHIFSGLTIRYFATRNPYRDDLSDLKTGDIPISPVRNEMYSRNSGIHIFETRIALAVVTEYGEYPCFTEIVLQEGKKGTWQKGNNKIRGDEFCGMRVFINTISTAVETACSAWGDVFAVLDKELKVAVSFATSQCSFLMFFFAY